MTNAETLALIADRIEAIAFQMKAPNAFTPQFIVLAQAVRGLCAEENNGDVAQR